MTIKLKQAINAVGGLNALQSEKLPIKVSYKISKLANKLAPDLDIFNKKRLDLIKEFGTENKENQTITVDPDKIEEYQKQLKQLEELLETDIEVNFGDGKPFEPIKSAELGNVSIEPKFLNGLDWLITDEA